MTRLRRAWLTLLLTGAALWLLVETRTLSPASREAPLAVVVPTLILLAVELVRDLRRPVHPPDVWEGRGRRAVRLVLWIVGFLALVRLVGLVAAAPVFLAAFLRVEAGIGWRRSLAAALGMGLVLAGLVEGVLGGLVPGGWIG